MNIGRTIRVFRAEPVVGPVPGPAPVPMAETARHVPEARQEPPVEVDAGQVAPPVRLGG